MGTLTDNINLLTQAIDLIDLVMESENTNEYEYTQLIYGTNKISAVKYIMQRRLENV